MFSFKIKDDLECACIFFVWFVCSFIEWYDCITDVHICIFIVRWLYWE